MASGRRSSLRHRSAGEVAAREPLAVRIRLLGGFELVAGRRRHEVPLHVQRLLAFLALRDQPLRREYVSGLLWLDATQEHAFASLRTALWRVRRLPVRVVQATSTHLVLAPSVVVDARELAASAERCLHGRAPPAAADVERLVEGGELLPDWYDEWVVREREELGQLRLLALEAACEALLDAGRGRAAATAALAAVAADPLRESARRLLIATYLRAGNRAEAARQLADFRRRLRDELGLAPSFRMSELERELGLRRR